MPPGEKTAGPVVFDAPDASILAVGCAFEHPRREVSQTIQGGVMLSQSSVATPGKSHDLGASPERQWRTWGGRRTGTDHRGKASQHELQQVSWYCLATATRFPRRAAGRARARPCGWPAVSAARPAWGKRRRWRAGRVARCGPRPATWPRACPAQYDRTPGSIAEPTAGCILAQPLPVGHAPATLCVSARAPSPQSRSSEIAPPPRVSKNRTAPVSLAGKPGFPE